MARCDEGYLCEVCGEEVETIIDSALYLQYVIGWVDPETLHTRRECHLKCHPTLAQFIDDNRFTEKIVVDQPFARISLDLEFASQRASLVTRGYQRLWELHEQRIHATVADYPLPDVLNRWR